VDCSKAVHSFRAFSTHAPTPLSQADLLVPRCDIHGKKFAIFCISCGIPVCPRCILDHPQHDYADIGTTAQEARDRFRTAQLYLLELKQSEERLGRSLAQLRSQTEESIQALKSFYGELRDMVTRREDHLLGKFKNAQEKNEQVVASQLDYLKNGQLGQLRLTLDGSDYADWERVSDVELLFMAKDLEETFHSLSDAKKNMPSQPEQVDASYPQFDGDKKVVDAVKKSGAIRLVPIRVGASSASNLTINLNGDPAIPAQDLSTDSPPPHRSRHDTRSRSRARSPSVGGRSRAHHSIGPHLNYQPPVHRSQNQYLSQHR